MSARRARERAGITAIIFGVTTSAAGAGLKQQENKMRWVIVEAGPLNKKKAERLYRVWPDNTCSMWKRKLGRPGNQILPLKLSTILREATPEDLKNYGADQYENSTNA